MPDFASVELPAVAVLLDGRLSSCAMAAWQVCSASVNSFSCCFLAASWLMAASPERRTQGCKGDWDFACFYTISALHDIVKLNAMLVQVGVQDIEDMTSRYPPTAGIPVIC